MKVVKPLLVGAALLVLSSASMARDVIGQSCRPSSKVISGYNVVLRANCSVTANNIPCGFYKNLIWVGDIQSVKIVGTRCTISY